MISGALDDGVLLFGPGLTDVCLDADGSWNVLFSGAVLVAQGRDLEAHQLSMTARFVPDAGCTDDRLAVSDGGPAGFTTQSRGRASSATYVYTFAADLGAAVHITEGQWFGTVPGAEQTGTFVVTFEAFGFRPATFSLRVPPAQQLVFQPGTSYVVPVAAPGGGDGAAWTLHLEGASLTVSGGAITEPLSLQLAIGFVSDDASVEVRVLDSGTAPRGWWPPQGFNPHAEAVFCYDGLVHAAEHDVVLPITDGSYVTTADDAGRDGGYFELRFSEYAFASTAHRFRVPSSLRIP